LINKIKNFIEKHGLNNKTVIVGFSGGYDSMCLLDILSKIKEEYSLDIIAAHYNHNWRGEIAKREQEVCRDFCIEKNLKFYTETADSSVKKTETVARELRYKFFERALKKYNADVVFTAHNFNDNAETLLYRIVKGTGIVGLNGILPKRGIYYRPLINISRLEIEQYSKENNLTPNVDDSNMDDIHKRNLIRNKILPLLKEINPEVITALNNLSKIARIENSVIDEYLSVIESDIFDNNRIRTPYFMKLSSSLKTKVIYNMLYHSEVDYNHDLVERCVSFIESTVNDKKPSKYSIGKDIWLYADKNIIEIFSKSDKEKQIIPIENCGNYRLSDYIFSIEPSEEYIKQNSEESACVDLSKYNLSDIVIRTRRDGDIIQPLGSDGKMKLKKYLMSKHIPQHKRDGLLLLCKNKEVLWVAGVGISDKIKSVSKSTHILKIFKKEV